MADQVTGDGGVRAGRPPSTSAAALEQLGLDLFAERGFEAVTVDHVAEAAGISRRTFFRYFASKNDLVWGDFEGQLGVFRRDLREHDALPMTEALRRAVVSFNRIDRSEEPRHRQRMQLILTVPALQAHSTLKYAAWRGVVEEFAAGRTGEPRTALLPRLLGHAALGASVAAYELWLADPGSDLEALLEASFAELASGFAGAASGAATPPRW